MAVKVIMVGTGGWGRTWCRKTLPLAVKEGLVEVVAAVDIVPENLAYAKEYLNLKDDQCFGNAEEAFKAVKADICVTATPPEVRDQIASLAMESGLDILSEKPMSDSMEGAMRILDKVNSTGRKMGITMSHKFRQDVSTLRDMLNSGEYGKLDYLVCNFNSQRVNSLSSRREDTRYTTLIEGSVHHLDILEDLSGAECETIFCESWTPSWGLYKGGSQALVTMRFKNGVRASYEAGYCNATSLNRWGNEHIRAECENASIVLNQGGIHCFKPGQDKDENGLQKAIGIPVKLKEGRKWGNELLLEKFITWFNGGEKMETDVPSNIRSMVLVFAAIKSSDTGLPVNIDTFMKSYGI